MRSKAGEEMRGMKLRWVVIFGLLVLGAGVAVPGTQANPPFSPATYRGTTSEGGSIVLVVNNGGMQLVGGSYIQFTCGGHPATVYLNGTSINNPAGITNRLGTGGVTNPDGSITSGFDGGTLSWRFFARFFASTASAGQTLPPGDLATGDFSGRNVTGIPGGVGFCSFRVTWNATKVG
jgi:hypothetical protein